MVEALLKLNMHFGSRFLVQLNASIFELIYISLKFRKLDIILIPFNCFSEQIKQKQNRKITLMHIELVFGTFSKKRQFQSRIFFLFYIHFQCNF